MFSRAQLIAIAGAILGLALVGYACSTYTPPVDTGSAAAWEGTPVTQDYAYAVPPKPPACTSTYSTWTGWLYWCDDDAARFAWIQTHPYTGVGVRTTYHTTTIKNYHYVAPKQVNNTSITNRITNVFKSRPSTGGSSRSGGSSTSSRSSSSRSTSNRSGGGRK